MNLRSFDSVKARRDAVENVTGKPLKQIGNHVLDETVAAARHCENMIGAVQVPLGIVGPLRVHSVTTGVEQEYLVPLATTEAALVASVNRGVKAITESGGAKVMSERVGPTRGPVFRVESIEDGISFEQFLENQFPELQRVAEETSHHLKLKQYFVRGAGKYRYVRFVFDTQDAMGLNMVTIATQAMVVYIETKTGIPCTDISGNYCVDKKPSWQNVINQRGLPTHAEITLSSETISGILKTTPEAIYESWLAKCMLGSAMSGSMAFNAQFANILAAIFLATGQDIAHVSEGSVGFTTTELISGPSDKALYVSIYLPDLLVGTVGGGTALGPQQEALGLLGVAGGADGKNALRFAEIIGATVLAGEISLLASLAEGSLARAHAQLARGKGQ